LASAMNTRLIAGGLLSYLYNYWLSNLPLRPMRERYLALYLGGFGENSSVQMGCRFLNGRKVFVGDRNVINFGCLFDGRHYPIRIGNDVSIGPEASILTLGHDPQSVDFADKGGEVIIGDRAWIAYRAIILPGVTIGEGAVVGAGAVVTRNVEPFSIVAGNPAKPIGQRNKALTYKLSYQPWLQ
jgi:acetyltransferase-like isoleucine patch superfamily enzyme